MKLIRFVSTDPSNPSFGIDEGERFALHATQLKEPIEVAALFDFGLTPRYVKELVRDDDEVREARPADLFNIQPQNNKISVRISRNQRKY